MKPLLAWLHLVTVPALVVCLVQLHDLREGQREQLARLEALSQALGAQGERPPVSAPAAPFSQQEEEQIRNVMTLVLQRHFPLPALCMPQQASAEPERRAPRPPPEDPGAPLDAPQLEKLEKARAIVQRALGARSLRREDVVELRNLSAGSPGPLRSELDALRDQLIQAINQQRLVPEDPAFVVF
jgi:hypothetical protein